MSSYPQQQLFAILQATLSPIKETRKQAQQELNSHLKEPNFYPQLLKFAVSYKDQHLQVAQQASIQLKNGIDQYWRAKDYSGLPSHMIPENAYSLHLISQPDQQTIRDSIIDALRLTMDCKPIYKQLLQAVKLMAKNDFKKGCDFKFLNQVSLLLSSEDDFNQFLLGVKVVKKLISCYEFYSQQQREPVQQLCASFFPKIEELIVSAIKNREQPNNSKNINPNSSTYEFINLSNKIFFKTVHFNLPKYFVADSCSSLSKWYDILYQVINLQDITQSPPTTSNDIETRQKYCYYKMKGISMRSAYTLIQQFGNKKTFQRHPQFKSIQQYLKNNQISRFIQISYKTILKARDYYFHSNQLNYSIKILTNTYKNAQFAKLVTNLLPQIIYDPCLHILQFTPKDEQLWEQDQIQYIRRSQNLTQNLTFYRNSMIDFIQMVVNPKQIKRNESQNQGSSKREKLLSALGNKKQYSYDSLQAYLKYIFKMLQEYKFHKKDQPDSSQNYRIKEALLLILGYIQSLIFKIDSITSQMWQLLQDLVLDFKSDVGIIRYRVACLFYNFGGYAYHKHCQSEQAADSIIQNIIKSLLIQLVEDKQFAPRVAAASALIPYMEYPIFANLVQSHLQQILSSYLSLIKEIQNEQLLSSLKQIISVIGDKIVPYSVQLAQTISKSFLKTALSNNQEDEDFCLESSDDWQSATECLEGLKKILSVCIYQPAIFQKVQHFISPVISYTLTPLGMEVTEDGLDLLSILLRYIPKFNDRLWNMLGLMCQAVIGVSKDPQMRKIQDDQGGWGFQYFMNMVLPLQILISKGSSAEQNSLTSYQIDAILRLCEKVLDVSSRGNRDCIEYIAVSKVLISLLECLKGRIDDKLPRIIQMVMKQLLKDQKSFDEKIRSILVQVISMTFYYNQTLMLQLLGQQQNMTEKVFEIWFNSLSSLKHDFQYRRMIFGLTSVLCAQNLPSILENNLPTLFKKTVKLIIQDSTRKAQEQLKESKELKDQLQKTVSSQAKKIAGEIKSEKELHQVINIMKQITQASCQQQQQQQQNDEDGDYQDVQEDGQENKKDQKNSQQQSDSDYDDDDLNQYYEDFGGDNKTFYQSPLMNYSQIIEFERAIKSLKQDRIQLLMQEIDQKEQDVLKLAFQESNRIYQNFLNAQGN